MHTCIELLADGWIGSKQAKDKCVVNAIQILQFVINHTILLPAKKRLSVNVTKISVPFKMLQILSMFS